MPGKVFHRKLLWRKRGRNEFVKFTCIAAQESRCHEDSCERFMDDSCGGGAYILRWVNASKTSQFAYSIAKVVFTCRGVCKYVLRLVVNFFA